jgi:hypothetical protein
MDFVRKMFSSKNEVSSMRVMAMLSLVVAAVIGVYGVVIGRDLGGLAQLCGVFVGAAFMGKATQKFAEQKTKESES